MILRHYRIQIRDNLIGRNIYIQQASEKMDVVNTPMLSSKVDSC